MKLSLYFLPFDVFIRHKFTSYLLNDSQSVLDVGGSLSKLGDFKKINNFKTADLKTADIIFDGKRLPLKSNSFEIVVSLDTIEHLKKDSRKSFFEELLRVAQKRLILAGPLGTKEHINYEEKQYQKLKSEKKKIPIFLKEHLKNGLPILEEIKSWLPVDYDNKLYFSENLFLTEKLFNLHLLEFKNPFLNKSLYYFKFLINFFSNLFLYPLMINLPYSQKINRFYLVIDKKP